MSRYNTTDPPRQDRALVTAAEWFGGGQRIPYDPESARVLTEEEAAATPGALRVFERVAAAEPDADTVWLYVAARLPGRLLRLGAGGPDAGRRPRPAAVRGAGRAGRLGQAPRLPVLQRRAREPDRGALAAPPRAPHRRRHLRLHVAGAARTAAPPAGAPPAGLGPPPATRPGR